MTTNSMQGTAQSGTQAGGGTVVPPNGAGGGQPGEASGVSRFNPQPNAVAEGGGSNGADPAVAGSAHGTPKGGAVAPNGGTDQQAGSTELQQQLDAALARVEQLQAELNGAIDKRKAREGEAKTLTQRITELEAGREQDRRNIRTNEAVEAALSKIPASQHHLAKAVIRSLPNDRDPIDLAGDDRATVVDAVMKRLGDQYPDLLAEPAAKQPAIPKIRGASPGETGFVAEKVGVVNREGKRIL